MPLRGHPTSNRKIGATIVLLIAAVAIGVSCVRDARAIDDPRELLKFLKKKTQQKDVAPKAKGVPGQKQFIGQPTTGPKQAIANPTVGPKGAVSGPAADGKNPTGKAVFGKTATGKATDGNAATGNTATGNAANSKLGTGKAVFGKAPAGKDGNVAVSKLGNSKAVLGNAANSKAANFKGVHSKIANSNNVFERRRLVAEHRRDLVSWRQLLPRRPLPGERGFTGVPPAGETRFVSTEMVFQAGPNVSRQSVDDAARRLGLTAIAAQQSGITGGTLYHFRVAGGRPVGDVVRSLEAENLGVASPNYVFQLHEETDLAARAAAATASGQYVVGKLRLGEVHQVATGSNVLIAVIDSKIDVNHPDLAGAIVEQFDATGRPDQPHTHGTGMVGAIVAHQRLMGIAPAARILAITAFSTARQTPEATTRNILVGLEWAIRKGARVVNMSFAGPYDPMLQLAMKNAAAKGVVLIAAAGNSGAKSPPLYPAADPHVIAVTATDENDKLFAQAVRGPHVAVAAPGVDVMVPAPDNAYQLTTGTSVAAAHVSGVAALLIERHPSVDAATVLEVLTSSAKRLNPKGRDDQFGWGLIDPASALAELDARMAAGNQVASPVTPTAPKAAAAKPAAPKPSAPKPASITAQ